MSKLIPGNQKHLTMDDRIIIEKGLDSRESFRSIAMSLGKDPTTISKEIKLRRIYQPRNTFNESRNRCTYRRTCKKKHICQTYALTCKTMCRSCPLCNRKCPEFTPQDYSCCLEKKAPFVCNGCPKKTGCRTDKYYYKATTANRSYRTTLVDSREGLNITEHDLETLDSVVSPLIRQGQSPYVILQNHPELEVSEKTIYNYIESGALSVDNLNLPKKVKYKPRRTKPKEVKDTGVYQGRTYADFCSFMEKYPETNVVEMDTVHGREGSNKVLLTFYFRNSHLLLAYLINDLKASSVKKVFDNLESKMTTFLFHTTFPVILTDRGIEFSNPDALETGKNGFTRTSIYYCDPMASWQKPHIEKEHVFLRTIWPKGSSFDDLKQFEVNRGINHICNIPRASINGLTPLKLAQLLIHEDALKVFNLHEIDCDLVTLTPKLVK